MNLTSRSRASRHLHRLQGDPRLALRARRCSVGSGRWTNREAGRAAARRTPAPRSAKPDRARHPHRQPARTDASQGAALESAPDAWELPGDSEPGRPQVREALLVEAASTPTPCSTRYFRTSPATQLRPTRSGPSSGRNSTTSPTLSSSTPRSQLFLTISCIPAVIQSRPAGCV